eukprot:12085101-Alexandrium_andersonii.AAC.1
MQFFTPGDAFGRKGDDVTYESGTLEAYLGKARGPITVSVPPTMAEGKKGTGSVSSAGNRAASREIVPVDRPSKWHD